MVLSEADFRESTADKIDSTQGNSHLERGPQWIFAGDRLLQRLIGPHCVSKKGWITSIARVVVKFPCFELVRAGCDPDAKLFFVQTTHVNRRPMHVPESNDLVSHPQHYGVECLVEQARGLD